MEPFRNLSAHFKCEVVKNLSTHLGVYGIYDLKTLFGDHFFWHDSKEWLKILAQFTISSFIIAEISGDKFSWRRTKFKIVAFLSHLLGSNNVRFTSLGDEIQKLIRI